MSKYDGNDNYGKPKRDYLKRVSEMDEKSLFNECEHMIWLSAYAANNSRSDYHWQCDACYDECFNRGKLDIYNEAWKRHSGN